MGVDVPRRKDAWVDFEKNLECCIMHDVRRRRLRLASSRFSVVSYSSLSLRYTNLN